MHCGSTLAGMRCDECHTREGHCGHALCRLCLSWCRSNVSHCATWMQCVLECTQDPAKYVQQLGPHMLPIMSYHILSQILEPDESQDITPIPPHGPHILQGCLCPKGLVQGTEPGVEEGTMQREPHQAKPQGALHVKPTCSNTPAHSSSGELAAPAAVAVAAHAVCAKM